MIASEAKAWTDVNKVKIRLHFQKDLTVLSTVLCTLCSDSTLSSHGYFIVL